MSGFVRSQLQFTGTAAGSATTNSSDYEVVFPKPLGLLWIKFTTATTLRFNDETVDHDFEDGEDFVYQGFKIDKITVADSGIQFRYKGATL